MKWIRISHKSKNGSCGSIKGSCNLLNLHIQYFLTSHARCCLKSVFPEISSWHYWIIYVCPRMWALGCDFLTFFNHLLVNNVVVLAILYPRSSSSTVTSCWFCPSSAESHRTWSCHCTTSQIGQPMNKSHDHITPREATFSHVRREAGKSGSSVEDCTEAPSICWKVILIDRRDTNSSNSVLYVCLPAIWANTKYLL